MNWTAQAWAALKPVILKRIEWFEKSRDNELIGQEAAALAETLSVAPDMFPDLAPILRRLLPFFAGGRFSEDAIKYICDSYSDEPQLSLDLLEELFRRRLNSLELWSSEEPLQVILTSAVASSNEAIKTKAQMIATHFFNAGQLVYRKFLD